MLRKENIGTASLILARERVKKMAKKYRIKAKRDFGPYGYFHKGKTYHTGLVVVKDGCNAVPGAGWFMSYASAMLAVEVLEETGDTMRFHEVYAQRSPEIQKDRREHEAMLKNIVEKHGGTVTTYCGDEYYA